MSFWFPDNVQRRDRAMQLSTDISNEQQHVVEAHDAMQLMNERMVPKFDELLHSQGMKSFTELQAKLEAVLDGEDKKKYKKLFERAQETSSNIDNSLMWISAITLISGVTKKSIDIGNFLRTGHVLITMKDYAKAFITLVTKGYQAGKAAFKAAAKSAKLAVEVLEDGSKVARYASKAARILKVIAILGVVADAVLLGYAYFAEKEQRDELQKAINDLYVRRITSKFYGRLCDAIKTQDGLFMAYIITAANDKTVDATNVIVQQVIQFIQNDYKKIDSATSLDLLIVMDKKRSSWTNEDPEYNSAVKDADTFKDKEDSKDPKPAASEADSFTSNVNIATIAAPSMSFANTLNIAAVPSMGFGQFANISMYPRAQVDYVSRQAQVISFAEDEDEHAEEEEYGISEDEDRDIVPAVASSKAQDLEFDSKKISAAPQKSAQKAAAKHTRPPTTKRVKRKIVKRAHKYPSFHQTEHIYDDEHKEAEFSELESAFDELLPPYSEQAYDFHNLDFVKKLHWMMDTGNFEIETIQALFTSELLL